MLMSQVLQCFILFSLNLLLPVIYAVKGYTKNTDIVVPKTDKQEVDLIYYKFFPLSRALQKTSIKGCTVKFEAGSLQQKNRSVLICKEQVNLLREKETAALWKKENRLHGFILLDMPEIGIYHVKTYIIAIKSVSKFNDSNIAYSINDDFKSADSMRPVTGVFIRHVTNVRKYLLKNSRTGRISAVNATPEHRFYVSNRQAFIPIAEVSMSDKLITDAGDEVRMIAVIKDRKQKQHHGKSDYSRTLKTVYNLEVSKKHTYFVSDLGVFVHNPYKVFYDRNGKIKFEGHLDDKLTGEVKLYEYDETLEREGNVKRNTPDGSVDADDKGALVYSGGLTKGEYDGYGVSYVYHDSPGANGHERFIFYDGYWKNNKYDGHGHLYFHGTNDVHMKGRFEKGELVEGEVYELASRIPDGTKVWYGLRYRGGLKGGRYNGYGTRFELCKHCSQPLSKQEGFWNEGKPSGYSLNTLL